MTQMTFPQRGFAYITRKKGKTISLFLVIFIVAVFLISCFRVLHASKLLGRDIRTSLGAAFYLRANTQVTMHENGEAEVTEHKLHITQKEIDEIMQLGEIKYCNPINYGFAKGDGIHFIPGDKHTQENDMGKVTALRFSALAPDFANETAVLTKGSHITEGDTKKILISQPLAEKNALAVGDLVTLTHAGLRKSNDAYLDEIPVKTAYVQVEISGIFQLHTQDTSIKPTAGLAENQLYASLDVLSQLEESEAGIYTGEVGFYLTDPANLDRITRQVRALRSIDWTTHFIRTNDFSYSKIAGQLASLGDFIKILLILVSVVSAAVLTLLLTMRMHSRMQEAGILLAAGIPKEQIMAGFLLEVAIITLIAFLLSYFASLGIAGFLDQGLFREFHPHLLNDSTLAAENTVSMQRGTYLELSGIHLFLLYLCQFLVIIASTFASSVTILRLKPKEILSK